MGFSRTRANGRISALSKTEMFYQPTIYANPNLSYAIFSGCDNSGFVADSRDEDFRRIYATFSIAIIVDRIWKQHCSRDFKKLSE